MGLRWYRVAFDENSDESRKEAIDLMLTTQNIIDNCRELGFDPNLQQVQDLLQTRGIDVTTGVDAQNCSVIVPKNKLR